MATATLPKPVAKRLWTFDEMVAELPESNLPTECRDGQYIPPPTPVPNPERIVYRFARLLEEFEVAKGLGIIFALSRGTFKLASKAENGGSANSQFLSGFTVTWSQLLL